MVPGAWGLVSFFKCFLFFSLSLFYVILTLHKRHIRYGGWSLVYFQIHKMQVLVIVCCDFNLLSSIANIFVLLAQSNSISVFFISLFRWQGRTSRNGLVRLKIWLDWNGMVS